MAPSLEPGHQEKMVRSIQPHNYYNFDTGAVCTTGPVSPRFSCSSESYTDSHSNDTESYRCHSSPHYSAHSGATPPGPALVAATPTEVTDEGYDSTSRELELI